MDSELRANPDDLVALLRAGRLSRERVAMAAYLGDQRALATGVEPWEPPEPGSPVEKLTQAMRHGNLTEREQGRLLLHLARQAAQRADEDPAKFRRLLNAWRGHRTLRDLRRELEALYRDVLIEPALEAAAADALLDPDWPASDEWPQ